MKRVKKILILVLAMASIFFISSSVVQAQQVTPSQPPIIKEDKPTVERAPKKLQLCPDLASELKMIKSLSGETATIQLLGQVCNKGMADYIIPPFPQASAVFYEDTSYPPLTVSQTGIASKEIGRPSIRSLKHGECMRVTKTVTLTGVLIWGNTPSTATERAVVKAFSLVLKNDTPNSGSAFKPTEDCNSENNDAHVMIQYMERVQPPRKMPKK